MTRKSRVELYVCMLGCGNSQLYNELCKRTSNEIIISQGLCIGGCDSGSRVNLCEDSVTIRCYGGREERLADGTIEIYSLGGDPVDFLLTAARKISDPK